MKAGRKGNTYSIYQESKIRHFHRTLDEYIRMGGQRVADPKPATESGSGSA